MERSHVSRESDLGVLLDVRRAAPRDHALLRLPRDARDLVRGLVALLRAP